MKLLVLINFLKNNTWKIIYIATFGTPAHANSQCFVQIMH